MAVSRQNTFQLRPTHKTLYPHLDGNCHSSVNSQLIEGACFLVPVITKDVMVTEG
jgi:hypothetical protein